MNNLLKNLRAPISLVRALSWKRKAVVAVALLALSPFVWIPARNGWAYWEGRREAQADWSAGDPRILCIGLMRPKLDANDRPIPPKDKATGLRLSSLGCDWTSAKSYYVKGYNARMRSLVPPKKSSATP